MSDLTLYERNVLERSKLRYYIGLIVRWKQHFKYARAVRIARRRGATIGEGVVMPISLAKQANANLTIGNHVSIHNTAHISSMRYKLTIGNNVIIGGDVDILMGGHNIDSTDWEHRRKTDGLVIEDYVWCCSKSMILPSCSRIGMGAVIGGGAVVAQNVGEMSVVSGNPAKEIRKRKCVHSDLVVESQLGGDYYIYKKTRQLGKCPRQ